MTRDPKQTQTMEEPQRPSTEQDLALRTTLVQPIPLSRHPDFVRTHYWEKRSSETEQPKRTAASYASANAGKTVVGLGPDDPIVQAVQAAKQQLLEAERAQQERTSHERPRVAEVAASTAKTVLMPALDVAQLMAARAKPASKIADEPVQLPKRKLKPFRLAGAALAVILCAATASQLMPASAPDQHTAESIVKPRPQAAPPQQSGTVVPAPGSAATSVNTPSQSPHTQVTEKAAVDALFAGDYTLAGRHYTALASAHPEQPAFAEAARILKRNARPDTN